MKCHNMKAIKKLCSLWELGVEAYHKTTLNECTFFSIMRFVINEKPTSYVITIYVIIRNVLKWKLN